MNLIKEIVVYAYIVKAGKLEVEFFDSSILKDWVDCLTNVWIMHQLLHPVPAPINQSLGVSLIGLK